MPQSLGQIYVHIVFSTHQRIHYLQDPDMRDAVHQYLGRACISLQCPALEIGGVEDHVHLACSLHRTMSAADLVRRLKKESSKWIKRNLQGLQSFYWQDGYGVFSVSPGHLVELRKYIRNQEEHHQSVSFQDEFRGLLRKYDIEYDEDRIWD